MSSEQRRKRASGGRTIRIGEGDAIKDSGGGRKSCKIENPVSFQGQAFEIGETGLEKCRTGLQVPEREEDFHFLWEQLHFDREKLVSEEGHSIRILHPGHHNRNQGPDFLDARIEIDGLEFHGHVELHLSSREWYQHRHHEDPRYNPVVLHVVMSPDGNQVRRQDGTPIPELSLAHRVDPDILGNIRKLRSQAGDIPCRYWLASSPGVLPDGMKSELGLERLRRKAGLLGSRVLDLTGDWEQVVWEELSGSLGGPVNGQSFRELARALPWRLIRKYAMPLSPDSLPRGFEGSSCPPGENLAASETVRPGDKKHGAAPQKDADKIEVPEGFDQFDRLALEALLFGVAGMLPDSPGDREPWPLRLRLEWAYLSQKHQLKPLKVPFLFHRMRPGAFPTIRLAQLADLIYRFPDLASLLNPLKWPNFRNQPIEAGRYWKTHLQFGKKRRPRPRRMGQGFKDLVILNTLAPLALLYSESHGFSWAERAKRKSRGKGNELAVDLSDQGDDKGMLVAGVGGLGGNENGGLLDELRKLPPEDNRTLRKFSAYGETAKDALEAQGLLELHNMYCVKGRCLECRFGREIISGKRHMPSGLP